MSATPETDNQVSPESQRVYERLPATEQFTAAFQERLGAAYSSDGSIEDMQASVNRDLPEAIEAGNLEAAQDVLESGWNGDRRASRLNTERRDALAELHAAEKGVPTPEQTNIAWQEAQKAVLGATHIGDENERSRVFNQLFGKHDSSAELEEGITLLESLITDESVVNPQGEKLEHLRIARDKFHQQYKQEKEMEDTKELFTGQLVELVGQDNELLTREGIETATSWLSGEAADNMRSVMAELEASDDPHERADLLTDLAHQRIPVHKSEEFAAWLQERRQKHSAEVDRQQQEAAGAARSKIDDIHQGQ